MFYFTYVLLYISKVFYCFVLFRLIWCVVRTPSLGSQKVQSDFQIRQSGLSSASREISKVLLCTKFFTGRLFLHRTLHFWRLKTLRVAAEEEHLVNSSSYRHIKMLNVSFTNSFTRSPQASISSISSPSSAVTTTNFNSANRPTPSPKCFGKNTHVASEYFLVSAKRKLVDQNLQVLKEDYERERIRWQQKLEEAEKKLNEASIHNSELFQIKAELVNMRLFL